MNRVPAFALLIALGVPFATGCATKNYVRNQTAPLVDKTNELDDLTAKNTRDLRDVDARAQQGIQGAQAKAAAADQKAVAAGQQAEQAQSLASQVATRADQLTTTVANLDNYRPVTETSVQFGFDKYTLTPKAKAALDELGAQVAHTEHYIVVVDGNTDSTGPADYNYQLSKRRADSVIQYLVSKYDVPAHKIYVIGLGKDKPDAPNSTASGRAKNRRVDVKLMTNMGETTSASAQTQPPSSPQQ